MAISLVACGNKAKPLRLPYLCILSTNNGRSNFLSWPEVRNSVPICIPPTSLWITLISLLLAINISIPDFVAIFAANSFVFMPPVPQLLPVEAFPICMVS